MLDYIGSKIAIQEHEQRVKSVTPVHDHADWLTDDRQLSLWTIRAGIAGATQTGKLLQHARRLLSGLSAISLLGKPLKSNQDMVLEASLKDHPC
jgi:hypothetical protein